VQPGQRPGSRLVTVFRVRARVKVPAPPGLGSGDATYAVGGDGNGRVGVEDGGEGLDAID
jgi:hypothetical protein